MISNGNIGTTTAFTRIFRHLQINTSFSQSTRFCPSHPSGIRRNLYFEVHIGIYLHFHRTAFLGYTYVLFRYHNRILLSLSHLQCILQITILVIEDDFCRTSIITLIRSYDIFQRMTGHTTGRSLIRNPIHIRHLYTIFHVTLDVHRDGLTGIAHGVFILRKHNKRTTCLINLHGFHLVATLESNFAFTFFSILIQSNIQSMLISGQSTTGSFGNPTLGISRNLHLIVDVRLHFDFYLATFLCYFVLVSSNQQSICTLLCNGKGLADRTCLNGNGHTTVIISRIFIYGKLHIRCPFASAGS